MGAQHLYRPLAWLVLGLVVLTGPVAAAGPLDSVHRMRAERRASLRARTLSAAGPEAKSGARAHFGLLVIPVDFADNRLPAGWDNAALASRLFPSGGETLRHYFEVASNRTLDLQITLAPLVRLPEVRRLYSDRDLNGFSRTRHLAGAAITAVKDLGLEFRRLDNDGPDGLPGTDDDDGQVDGVLILHGAPGVENDPQSGLIQPLQFFLDEPVVSQGVAAAFYAVASLQSGPGIWAHETAHLLGLEDRYDPLLHPGGASDVRSLGGLGRFSLMGSGAWGTGGGYGAALPDAYSALQVGWREARNLTGSAADFDTVGNGTAARVWSRAELGPEFFLLEVRDPDRSAPFDAAVPGEQLLVYHIDERLPEGAWQDEGPGRWHLRANLVEADADRSLATGQDDGSLSDLFPGAQAASRFGPFTSPSSQGYSDGPSGVTLADIEPLPAGVRFRTTVAETPQVRFDLAFGRTGTPRPLTLQVTETGAPLAALSVQLQATSSTEQGHFASTGTRLVSVDLAETSAGLWQPVAPVGWVLDSTQGPDTATRFSVRLFDGAVTYAAETRTWVWQSSGAGLDFRQDWPGEWTIAYPDGDLQTTWQRWEGSSGLALDGAPVLACTGAAFADGTAWPAVSYGNNAHTTLTSAPLAADVQAVRLVHGIEVEMLSTGVGMDGGLVLWVGPDGAEVPARPLNGYDGRISNRSRNPLHGQAAFVGAEPLRPDDRLLWRTDVFPLPTTGFGPWRLRLAFAANSLWRARGWFIADIEPLPAGAEPPAAFTPQWGRELSWPWPWPTIEPVRFAVEIRSDERTPWRSVLSLDLMAAAAGRYSIPADDLAGVWRSDSSQRYQVHVVGSRPLGEVASGPIVVYPDGGAAAAAIMGAPWPNPTADSVRFLLDLPVGSGGATLKIYDTRGRLVAQRRFDSGRQLATWDGLTAAGGRAAAGTYFLRLEGLGRSVTRKVVLLH